MTNMTLNSEHLEAVMGMTTMTIRNIDEPLKARLRIRAAEHGRSMEEEARDILRSALNAEPETGRSMLDAIRSTLGPDRGFDLELPPREPMREPPDLST